MLYSVSELKNNSITLEKWQSVVFADFDAVINNKERPFPCLFGVNGYRKNMLRFSFFEEISAKNIRNDLITYCENYKCFGKQTSLVIFEKPSVVKSISYYRDKFWQILKDLVSEDIHDWPQQIPENLDHPAWEFCFHKEPIFVICNTPAHVNRLSRRSPGFMLTFQPRWVFDDLLDTEQKATRAFATVTERLQHYDITDKSPLLGKYGNLKNRE